MELVLACFLHLSYTVRKEIRVPPNIRAFPAETLSQTPELEITLRQVDREQNWSTV